MADTLAGTLPGGLVDSAGTLHRGYELVALTGDDEELLVRAGPVPTAERVTAVLARTVTAVGSLSPVTEDTARAMLVGDRQFLLLRLRQATFGDQVRAHLRCPWRDCGQQVSIDFSLTELAVIESSDKGPDHVLQLSEQAMVGDPSAERSVSFRLPTGADQEQVEGWLVVNEAQALTRLLERCLGGGAERVRALSARARYEIEAEMRRLAPGIEQELDVGCAECGRGFAVPFDVQRFFFGELRTDTDLLYREVHYLAYHYHWAEREIMAMSRAKRHTYLDVLADEIDRLNDGA